MLTSPSRRIPIGQSLSPRFFGNVFFLEDDNHSISFKIDSQCAPAVADDCASRRKGWRAQVTRAQC